MHERGGGDVMRVTIQTLIYVGEDRKCGTVLIAIIRTRGSVYSGKHCKRATAGFERRLSLQEFSRRCGVFMTLPARARRRKAGVSHRERATFGWHRVSNGSSRIEYQCVTVGPVSESTADCLQPLEVQPSCAPVADDLGFCPLCKELVFGIESCIVRKARNDG